jgi:hypothetical protein
MSDEFHRFSTTANECKHFVAAEFTNVWAIVHPDPFAESLQLTPHYTDLSKYPVATVKNLPISKGSITLTSCMTGVLATLLPGEWAESTGHGWIVKSCAPVKLPCDCGSRATYGEGGPHAHWCSTNG